VPPGLPHGAGQEAKAAFAIDGECALKAQGVTPAPRGGEMVIALAFVREPSPAPFRKAR